MLVDCVKQRCKKGVILYLRQANRWSCWRPQKMGLT